MNFSSPQVPQSQPSAHCQIKAIFRCQELKKGSKKKFPPGRGWPPAGGLQPGAPAAGRPGDTICLATTFLAYATPFNSMVCSYLLLPVSDPLYTFILLLPPLSPTCLHSLISSYLPSLLLSCPLRMPLVIHLSVSYSVTSSAT